MAELIDGVWLNQYVAPQLLEEFRNYNDAFIGLLQPAPSGAISADGIRRNKLINNVGFYVNNTDGFISKKMDTQRNITTWDKLDTDPTEVDDAEMRSLPFDKRNAVRMKHTKSFRIGVRDYALNKLAPNQATEGMPVLRTTGDVINGRRRLTYIDLINFYEEIKGLNLDDPSAENLNLCREHHQDLIIDRATTDKYRDIVIDPKTGEIRRFYTFNLWTNNANPKYTAAGVLKGFRAIPEPTDKNASSFFYAPNTVYHINNVKILYSPEHEDTESADPTSKFRTQTYGLCDKVQEYGFGAIVSGNE